MVKNLPIMQETREMQVWSLDQENPLEEEMATTPVFSPGKFHEQKSLVSYSTWGWKDMDMTEHTYTHTNTYGNLPGISSVQLSPSVVSDSLWQHESQHVRPPCPSQTPGVYSNSCPSSRWCHPAISSSVVPFSSFPQSLPASGSFPMSQLFAWGGQSIGVSASTTVLPMNTQDWSPLGWTGWISLQFKELSRVFSNTMVQKRQFFSTQPSSQPNSHIHTWPRVKPQPLPDGPLLAK